MLFWRGKAAAILYAAIIFTVTFIAGTADVFAAVDDHTVQGKTPQGTVISLFDYWVNEQSSPDHGTSNNNSSGGINKSHSLKFSNGQGDGFNGWTGGKAPHSGMLDKTLDSSGYPSLAPDFGSWIFYSESLAYLFDDTKVEGKKAYNNVEGLMQVDDDGYYYYDSTKNFASYDEKTNSMKLYDKPAVKEASSSSKIGQFFPFDSASKVFNESSGQLVANTGVRADSSNVNHWFGLTMSTHFLHPADGKTTRGQDITYEFSGDDDVWVFIDDVLVGDLGGIHDKADLNINFSTGAVAINGESDGTIKAKFEEAGKAGDIDWSGNTFAGGTYHTLKFFYLERGNYASNMSLKFNLKLMPDNEAAKVDQYENPLEGATFSLYEADRTENDGKIKYSAKGESICTGTTDINGSLKLKAADGATINFEELYKKNKGPYYILKETKAPAGYKKAEDVWLQYDSKTGAVTTENMWESGIQANPRIMATAPTYMYDRFGNQIEMDSDGSLKQGSIFAIVYKRNDMNADFGDDSNWSSVSGSVLDGWQLHEADTIEGALEGNRYELKLNSMGAYETTLDELPGDIMTYSKVIIADNRGSSVEELAEALQKKAKYSILFYYTTGDINSADSSNTVRLDTGILSQNSNVRGFEYQYAVKLVATDIRNDLYVRKFDEYSTTFNSQEHSVSGVKFALYSEDQTTLLSRLRGDVKLKDDAVPVQEQTTRDIISQYGSVNLYGTAVFKKLENGTYYLKEVSAPSGYKVKDELIKVVVNDNGAFADAGEKDDGIYVGRGGSGTLLNSMEQFANNNDIDKTLTNMKINLRVSESEPQSDGSWKDAKIIHDDPLHIRYTEIGEASHVGHYNVQNDDGSSDDLLQHVSFFTTDTGWPSVVMQQCPEHDSGSSKAEKTDLGDTNLAHLLILETMVMVKDETIGDLEISKKVTNDSSDNKFEDEEFKFDVKLYETVKNGDGTETKKPVSGDFACVIKSSGSDDKEQTVTFDTDGKAVLTLKTGQSILIKDLPASAEYEVKEKAADYWIVSSSKDGAEYEDGKTVKGTIPEPADDGSKQKSTVAYNNTYSPEAATLSIPVEKKFNAWNDEAFEKASFDIRLTAIGNTGSGDVNKTMPEGATLDGEGRVTVAESIAKSGSKADSKGYVSSTGSFDGLTFTHAGTYIYTLKEIFGDVTSVTFNKVGTYRFRVKENVPADAKDSVKKGITYDDNISTVTVTVTDKDDDGNKTGRLKALVSYENSSNDETGLAKFVNRYKESGSYDITGVKTIECRDFAEGDSFTFTITPDGSAPYPVDENGKEVKEVTIKPSSGNSADLDFGKVKFSKAGVTYKYTLREKIPADADNNVKDGVTYDTTSYELTLTSSASDPRDGKLAISSSLKAKAGGADAVNADTVSWTNSYSAAGSMKLEGTKTLRGRDWKEGDSFTFTLWATADNEELLAAVPNDSYHVEGDKAVFGVVTADYEDAKGQQTVTLDFDSIRFTKDSAGEPYEFFITETVPGRSEVKGIVYDSEPHRIPVYVTDDGKGSLAAEVAKDSITNLDFYNTYSSSVIYSDQAGIVITKTLDGRDMEDGQFTFIVKALDNEDGNTTADDAAYKLGFGREQTEKEFKSTAALDGQSCTIDVLDGTAVKFTQNDGGKTFSYEISEQNDGKSGYSYDGHTYRVDIKVTDDGEGVLSAQTTVKDKAAGKQIDRTSVSSRAAGDRKIAKVPFANTYEASGELNGDGTVKIEAQKTLSGRDMKDGEFRFRITNAEDEAEQKTVIAEGTNAAAEAGKAGAVEFGRITYTTKQLKKDVEDGLAVKKDGKYVYQYLVSEVTDKLPAGVSPVKSSFSILVTVSDNGDGTLKTEVTYPDGSDKLAFENEYDTNKASIPVTGLKLLENEHEGLVLTPADITGRFTFTLTGVETTQGVVESAAPVPVLDGREMTEAVNGATGEIDFGRIVLQASDFEGVEPDDDGMRTRTFRYTITESGSFAGVTNDSNVSRDVNVTVKYSDSEKRFYVEDIDEEEAFSFVNTYGIEDKTVDIGTMFRVDKILTGRDLKEGEFRFELLEMKDGEQSVIATGTNAAAEAGKAGSVDFGQITYSEPGEHDYVIREVVPAGGRDANTIFDTAGHSVHVSVKDNKDGTLSVTSSASEDDHIVFNNKQVKKDDPSKGGDHGANGGSHTNTGDRTPVGMIIAIMIAALCIIAAVVIVSRRKSRK